MSDATSTVQALNCPQCGGAIELRAAGFTVSLICGHCGSTLDMTQDTPKLIAAAAKILSAPAIPLGSRGTLQGTEWEVVGYLERSGGGGSWSEYLLFNPYHGYRFLVDDNRSWSLGRLLDSMPANGLSRSIPYEGRYLEQFDKAYRATVDFVVGEFYWRVVVGETVMVRDYVYPGTMVSREEEESEVNWTRLDILPSGAVEAAFGLERRSRDWNPPSPHEPSPYGKMLTSACGIAIAAVLILLFSLVANPARQRLFAADADIPLDEHERTVVMGPFQVTYPTARIVIRAQAMVLDNQWIDLDYSLVNRRTQEEFAAYGLAEYYHGYDSDGSWSEGDRLPHTQLARVPAGQYDLVIDVSAHRWRPPYDGLDPPADATTPLHIEIEQGGGFAGNLGLAVVLILIWPAFLIFAHYRFEGQRRQQSSYYGS